MNRRSFLKLSTLGSASVQIGHPSAVEAAAGVYGKLSSSGFKTGSQALVDALQAEEVDFVSGIPGAQSNELWDMLKDRGIRCELVTNEQCAGFVADGYARATGKPGVLAVVPGPGLTNIATAIGEAFLDSVPLVVLVTDVATDPKHHFRLHEVDQVSISKPMAKAVYTISNITQVQTVVHQAFADACSGEPGPVIVIIPNNIYIDANVVSTCPPKLPTVPDQSEQLNRAVRLIADSKQIGLYVGAGCLGDGVQERLIELASVLAAPVGSTISGKGAFPDYHRMSVGFGFGAHATPWSEFALQKVDTLIAIGVKFSEVATGSYAFPKPKHLIHVDINSAVFNQNYKADVTLEGDSLAIINELLRFRSAIQKKPDVSYLDRIRSIKREYCRRLRDTFNDQRVNPRKFMLHLRELLGAEDVMVVDEGSHAFYAVEAYEVFNPRTFFAPADFGCMGYSIPAAIGAKLALKDRHVITITGDGSFLMTGMEMLTAARCEIPIKVFLFSSGGTYDLMQKFQLLPYGRTNLTMFRNPGFRELTESFGIDYFKIENDYQIQNGIHQALASKKPMLIEVEIATSEPLRYVEASMAANSKRFTAPELVRYIARGLGRRLLPQKND